MNRIKELRLQKNLTQEDIAKHVGASRVAVRNWENGVHPNSKYILKLAEILEVNPMELFSA